MLPTPTPVLVATYLLPLALLCVVGIVVRKSPQRDRLLGTWLALILGGFAVASAIQIRTWHGRGSWRGDPDNQVFVGSWLASELWVNRGLLVVGVATVLVGVAFFLSYPRLTRRP